MKTEKKVGSTDRAFILTERRQTSEAASCQARPLTACSSCKRSCSASRSGDTEQMVGAREAEAEAEAERLRHGHAAGLACSDHFAAVLLRHPTSAAVPDAS